VFGLHSLLPILQAFAQRADAVDGSTISAAEFRAAVQAAGVGPDKDIPHVTRQLILKYAGSPGSSDHHSPRRPVASGAGKPSHQKMRQMARRPA
jgi:hypothetical protein